MDWERQFNKCIEQRDAAQSELTALKAELASEEQDHAELRDVVAKLREELAQSRILAADQALNLKRVKREFESMRDRKNSIVDLQQRLTATEQRNAVLMQIIGNAFERLVCITPRNKPSGFLKQQAMDILQSAALKPTESGASDYLESCKAADEALRTKP